MHEQLTKLLERTLLREMECTRNGNLVGQGELRALRSELQAARGARSSDGASAANDALVVRAEATLAAHADDGGGRRADDAAAGER